MRLSKDRILTTHVGSLPRSEKVFKLIFAKEGGKNLNKKEYDDAKEAQGMLELQISKLENTLANARLVDESELDTSKVLVYSSVEVKNQSNGLVMNYKLVAETEADLKAGKISVESPIGKGLLGKKEGEIAEIKVPNGIIKLEINKITRD